MVGKYPAGTENLPKILELGEVVLVRFFIIILAAAWKTVYKDWRQGEHANKSFVLMFKAEDKKKKIKIIHHWVNDHEYYPKTL